LAHASLHDARAQKFLASEITKLIHELNKK